MAKRYDGAMKLPVLLGTIRRRILANWSVDGATAQARPALPPGVQPGDYVRAVVNLCDRGEAAEASLPSFFSLSCSKMEQKTS